MSTETTNADRASFAEAALAAYRTAKEQREPDEADARDLIGDLLHYLTGETDQSLAYELRCALGNFLEEAREEWDDPNSTALDPLETAYLALSADEIIG